MKAVLYTRVSTEAQEDGTSLAAQFAACSRKALDLNMQVVAHFEEVQTGAAYRGRTKLQSAIELIEEGKASALICYTLDRFSRDREHQETIKKRIERAGGQLIFCTQEFADTPEGDLMFGVTGTFTDYERKVIRRRTMSGYAKLVEKGITPSRRFRPYGYELIRKNDPQNREPGTFVVIENEAATVREMFQKYADGASLSQLCRWLYEAGIPTMYGGIWRIGTVAKMLRNTTYIGQHPHGKTKPILDESRIERGMKSKYTVPRATAEYKFIPCPAIISEELFNAVQSRITHQRGKAGRNDRKYLLTGLIKCAGCGYVLSGTKDPRGLFWYRCKHSEPNSPRCEYNPRNFKMETLDHRVIDIIIHVASNPELMEAAYDKYISTAKQAATKTDAGKLRKELVELKKRERALIESQISAKLTGADGAVYEQMISETSHRRGIIESKLAAIEHKTPSRESITKTLSQFTTESIDNIRVVLESAEIANHVKNQLLSNIIIKVVPVSKSTLQVYFHTETGWELAATWANGTIKMSLARI